MSRTSSRPYFIARQICVTGTRTLLTMGSSLIFKIPLRYQQRDRPPMDCPFRTPERISAWSFSIVIRPRRP